MTLPSQTSLKQRRIAWPKVLPVASLIAFIILFDQVTKFIVRQQMYLGQSWPEGWPVRFTRVNNSGSAFGLFGDQTIFLIIASIIAIGVMVMFYRQASAAGSGLLRFSLGLQLGGALSNLADRIRDGYVTDFIELPRWPVFNVADSAITIGIVMLVIVVLFFDRSRARAKPAP